MKTKSFQKYLEKRLDRDEIADIKNKARLELEILESIQKLLSDFGIEPQELFKYKKK